MNTGKLSFQEFQQTRETVRGDEAARLALCPVAAVERYAGGLHIERHESARGTLWLLIIGREEWAAASWSAGGPALADLELELYQYGLEEGIFDRP